MRTCTIRTRFVTHDELAAVLPIAVAAESSCFVPAENLRLSVGETISVRFLLIDGTPSVRRAARVRETFYDEALPADRRGFTMEVEAIGDIGRARREAPAAPAAPREPAKAERAAEPTDDFDNPLRQLDTNMLALFVEFSLAERQASEAARSMDEIPSMASWADGAEVDDTPRPELLDVSLPSTRRSTASVLAAITELPPSLSGRDSPASPAAGASGLSVNSGGATRSAAPASPPQHPTSTLTGGQATERADVAVADAPTDASAEDADPAQGRRLRQRAFAALAIGIASGAALTAWLWWRQDVRGTHGQAVTPVAAVASSGSPPGATPVAAPVAEPQAPDETKPATKPEAALEPATKPATKPEAALEPATKPATKPEAALEPATKPATKPEAALEPATKPATKVIAREEATPSPTPQPERAAPTGDPTACRTTVTSKPPGVEIWLGDKRLGETPATNLGVPCGASTLVLRHPRYAEAQVEVTGTLGQTAEVARKLERPSAKLQVTSEPPGAEVITRGKVRGRTPFELDVLQYEGVEIEVRLEGHAAWKKQLRPTAPELTVHAELKRE